MPDLPKSIRVGYRDYVVEDWAHNDAQAEGRYGDCDKLNGKIRICTAYGAQQTAETIMHETFHACWESGALSGKEPEERVVTVLARQFAQVFRDNPELIDFFSTSLA